MTEKTASKLACFMLWRTLSVSSPGSLNKGELTTATQVCSAQLLPALLQLCWRASSKDGLVRNCLSREGFPTTTT